MLLKITFLIIFSCFLIINLPRYTSADSSSKTIAGTLNSSNSIMSINNEIDKLSDDKMFLYPYFDFVFGARGSYSFIQGTYRDYEKDSFLMGIFFTYNPRIISGLLAEAELGYSLAKVKFDDNGQNKIFLGTLNAKYIYPVFSFVDCYGLLGGGIDYRSLHTDYLDEKDTTFINPILKAGLGIDITYDYTYKLDIRGEYRDTFYKAQHKEIGVCVGLGYAIGGDPGRKYGNYLNIEPNLKGIYPAQSSDYSEKYLSKVSIKNNLKRKLLAVSIAIKNDKYLLKEIKSSETKEVLSGAKVDIPVPALLNDKAQQLSDDKTEPFELIVYYKVEGIEDDLKMEIPLNVTVYRSHAVTWDNTKKVGSFITFNDKVISDFVRGAVLALKPLEEDKTLSQPIKNITKAIQAYSALSTLGLKYVSDPNGIKLAAGSKAVIDTIQYPREFLQSKTGDCDDFSVLYCSILENIGVPTALITIPGHIFIAFDTGIEYSKALKIFCNSKHLIDKDIQKIPFNPFIEKNGNAWIPIETTVLNRNESFLEAWKIAIYEYQNAGENREFTEVVEATKSFLPYVMPEVKGRVAIDKNKLGEKYRSYSTDIRNWVKSNLLYQVNQYKKKKGYTPTIKQLVNQLVQIWNFK